MLIGKQIRLSISMMCLIYCPREHQSIARQHIPRVEIPATVEAVARSKTVDPDTHPQRPTTM